MYMLHEKQGDFFVGCWRSVGYVFSKFKAVHFEAKYK